MERLERAVWVLVASLLVFDLVSRVAPNAEADALNALKTNLSDPNNILQSWNLTSLTDPTLDNPCAWSHVTCNGESSITRVTLGNANLSGQLVPQLGQLSNLQYLELYGNNISGRIPEELGNLTNLVSLGLHLNSLDGVIPPTLGKLSRLRFLRLNNNILSGRIPMSLTDIMSLQVLDLSNNQLTGNIPFGSFSSFSPISFANNSFIYPPPSPPLPIQSIPPATSPVLGSFTEAIAGEVAAGAALLFAALAIALSYWRRRKPQDHFFDVPAEEDPEVHLGQLKRFSLRELQVATDNFSNKNILGRGGFGKVYRGRLADGSLVAVKILKELRTHGGERQFQTEVEMINMAVHRNLLRLRGFCMTPMERLLIYPFMGNGSLASCVRDRPPTQPPLDWQIRRRIALGAARGLAYLHDHCDPKIIHRNVKASNIFLDEEFEAVVGDFGLAKLMDYKDTHIITNVCGTIGFMATEYLNNGKVSEKTDVFGYGVMLLELITGQRAFDLARLANGNDVWLLHWVTGLFKERKLEQLVDCDMDGNYIKEEVELLIQLALLCTQGSPTERPKMSDVVRMLNSASPEDFGTQGESQIFNFFSKIWCPSLQRTKGGRPGHPRSKPWLMLEGHGLAERWEEWQNTHPHHPSINWMVDSTSHI